MVVFLVLKGLVLNAGSGSKFWGYQVVIMACCKGCQTIKKNQMMKVGTSTAAFFSFALRFSSSSFFCLRLTR